MSARGVMNRQVIAIAFAAAVALCASSVVAQEVGRTPADGDWPQRRYDAAGTAFNSAESRIGVENLSKLKEKWRFRIPKGAYAPPIVAGGRVYVRAGRKILALDAKTGSIARSYDPAKSENRGSYGSLAVAEGALFTISFTRAGPALAESFLYAQNVSDGALRWRTQIPVGKVGYIDLCNDTTPAIAGRVIYLACGDLKLYAISMENGAVLWSTDLRRYMRVSAVVAGESVFALTAESVLHKLDRKTGKELWFKKVSRYYSGTPVVAAGRVFASGAGVLSAYDAEDGTLLWSTKIAGAVVNPAVADGFVVAAASTGHVYALDAATGAIRWKVKAAQLCNSNATDGCGEISIANGVVYVGSSTGLTGLELKTGKARWSKTIGESVWHPTVISNGNLYFMKSSFEAFGQWLYAMGLPN